MSRGGADTCKCNLRIRRVGKTRAIRNGDLSTSPLVCADKSPFAHHFRQPSPLSLLKRSSLRVPRYVTHARVFLSSSKQTKRPVTPIKSSRFSKRILDNNEEYENIIRELYQTWLLVGEKKKKKGSTNSTVNIASQPSSVAFERDSR